MKRFLVLAVVLGSAVGCGKSDRADPQEAKAAVHVPIPKEEGETQKLQRDWAKKLTLEVETKNPTGIVMVVIPPGAAAVPKPYLMGKYEVTQGEWESVMGYNPSAFQKRRKNPPNHADVEGLDTRRFPVENVTWYDCVEFCNKLSEKEGLKPYYQLKVLERNPDQGILGDAKVTILGGTGYHVPTGAEWVHACRAGSNTKYHFGDRDEELPDYAWFNKNSGKRTHQVGELKPNAFGLFDMHGNVYEWTEDLFEGAPLYITRGGDWFHTADIAAVAADVRWWPGEHNGAGLRLARVP